MVIIRWVVIYISNNSLTPRCYHLHFDMSWSIYILWCSLVGAQPFYKSSGSPKLHEAYFPLVAPLMLSKYASRVVWWWPNWIFNPAYEWWWPNTKCSTDLIGTSFVLFQFCFLLVFKMYIIFKKVIR